SRAVAEAVSDQHAVRLLRLATMLAESDGAFAVTLRNKSDPTYLVEFSRARGTPQANGGSMRVIRFAVLAVLIAAPLSLRAQWANTPAPGVPRLADGKPDLSAPSPRASDGKPDLSGVWRASTATGKYV